MDGKLYAVTPEGKQQWAIFTGGVRESSPVIDQNGFICLGVNNVFTAYPPDGSGKKVWDMGVENIDSSGAVTADGRVIFTSQYGAIYSFSTNGAPQWSDFLGEVRSASPNVAPDGTIYLGTCSTKLFAIKGTTGLAASPWPVFRGNARQTGRAPGNH